MEGNGDVDQNVQRLSYVGRVSSGVVLYTMMTMVTNTVIYT